VCEDSPPCSVVGVSEALEGGVDKLERIVQLNHHLHIEVGVGGESKHVPGLQLFVVVVQCTLGTAGAKARADVQLTPWAVASTTQPTARPLSIQSYQHTKATGALPKRQLRRSPPIDTHALRAICLGEQHASHHRLIGAVSLLERFGFLPAALASAWRCYAPVCVLYSTCEKESVELRHTARGKQRTVKETL
jgi:hypothetical protein